MAKKSAENRPASDFFVISLVRRYAAMLVRAENTGAMNTHTFLMSIGIDS